MIEVADTAEQSPTNFLGYEHDHTGADVEAILDVGDRKGVVLNNSVLYAEMGGQVADQGEMIGESGSWKIEETRKTGDTWIHLIAGKNTPTIGEHVTVRIDRTRRAAIERHHTRDAFAPLGAARSRESRRDAKRQLRRTRETDLRFLERSP